MIPRVVFSNPFCSERRFATREFMLGRLGCIGLGAAVAVFSYKFEDNALARALASVSGAGGRVQLIAHDSAEFRDEREAKSQKECFAIMEAAGIEIVRTASPAGFACAQHVKMLMIHDHRGTHVISPAQNFTDHLADDFCEVLHFEQREVYDFCLARWSYCYDYVRHQNHEIQVWPSSPALEKDESALTFIPTRAGSLVADWLAEVESESKLMISMPRWTVKGMNTARAIRNLAHRGVKIEAIVHSEKTHQEIADTLIGSHITLHHHTAGVPRYLVEVGDRRRRVLRPSVNFNGTWEKHHDLAYLTQSCELVDQYVEHWNNMRSYLSPV